MWTVLVEYGGAGKHVVAVPPDQIVAWLKVVLAVQAIYVSAVTLPKVSISNVRNFGRCRSTLAHQFLLMLDHLQSLRILVEQNY